MKKMIIKIYNGRTLHAEKTSYEPIAQGTQDLN